MFQSTRPQGARQGLVNNLAFIWCFNPRARRGRDWQGRSIVPAGGVSIHAPAGGATEYIAAQLYFSQFQSTRPQGARLGRCCEDTVELCFNPRARRGRDLERQQ